jgi:hypothetical protein
MTRLEVEQVLRATKRRAAAPAAWLVALDRCGMWHSGFVGGREEIHGVRDRRTIPKSSDVAGSPCNHNAHLTMKRPGRQSVLLRGYDYPQPFVQKPSTDSSPVGRIGGHFVLRRPSSVVRPCARKT